jgi:hypothetical protein
MAQVLTIRSFAFCANIEIQINFTTFEKKRCRKATTEYS